MKTFKCKNIKTPPINNTIKELPPLKFSSFKNIKSIIAVYIEKAIKLFLKKLLCFEKSVPANKIKKSPM